MPRRPFRHETRANSEHAMRRRLALATGLALVLSLVALGALSSGSGPGPSHRGLSTTTTPTSRSPVTAATGGSVGAIPTTGSTTSTQRSEPADTTSSSRAASRSQPSGSKRVPDAHNSGVPKGTRLTPAGSFVVTSPGFVIDAKDVSGCIEVRASRVVIRRTRIRCNSWYPIRQYPQYQGLLVEDTEIDGLNSGIGVAIGFANYTVRRAHIHRIADGPRMGSNTVVEESYIHDLTLCKGCHNDGIQSTGGRNIFIRGNNIQHPGRQTSAIMLSGVFEPLTRVQIEGNLLNGGNYTIYVRGRASTDVIVRGNRFGRGYVHGLLSKEPGAGPIWAGNLWSDTRKMARHDA